MILSKDFQFNNKNNRVKSLVSNERIKMAYPLPQAKTSFLRSNFGNDDILGDSHVETRKAVNDAFIEMNK